MHVIVNFRFRLLYGLFLEIRLSFSPKQFSAGYSGLAARLTCPRGFWPITSVNVALNALMSTNFTRRMLATNWLVDHAGPECIEAVRKRFQEQQVYPPGSQVSCAWVLLRLGDLGEQDIDGLLRSENAETRSHGFQMIASVEPGKMDVTEKLIKGFSDQDMRVRRSAVLSAKEHADLTLIRPLLQCFTSTREDDVHLRHAIRMTLRDHFLVEDSGRRARGTGPSGRSS